MTLQYGDKCMSHYEWVEESKEGGRVLLLMYVLGGDRSF
jgi:hypothetical protein